MYNFRLDGLIRTEQDIISWVDRPWKLFIVCFRTPLLFSIVVSESDHLISCVPKHDQSGGLHVICRSGSLIITLYFRFFFGRTLMSFGKVACHTKLNLNTKDEMLNVTPRCELLSSHQSGWPWPFFCIRWIHEIVQEHTHTNRAGHQVLKRDVE